MTQLFIPKEYSDTEKEIIKKSLSEPVVVKYLRGLAELAASDMVSSSSRITEDPHLYQVKNAALHGAISTLLDLITIATSES